MKGIMFRIARKTEGGRTTGLQVTRKGHFYRFQQGAGHLNRMDQQAVLSSHCLQM